MAAARFHDVSEEDDKQNKRKFSCSDYHLSNYTKTITFLRLGEYCRIIIFIQQYSLRLRRIIVKCLFFSFLALGLSSSYYLTQNLFYLFKIFKIFIFKNRRRTTEAKTNKAEGNRYYLMFKLLFSKIRFQKKKENILIV